MDLKSVEEIAKQIQRSLFKNSNSYSIGMLKSHFRGSGLQFKEHQIYCHGDDVRFIDWKMLAKTNHPYIKTFEEERNVEIVVLLDISLSMFQGFEGTSKLQAAIEIICLLYLLADESKDFVRPIIIGESVVTLQKRSGKIGIVELISTLQNLNVLNADGKVNIKYRPKEHADIRAKEIAVMKYLSKGKEVVILSDFHDFLDEKFLKRIFYKKHFHCFQLSGPLDENMKTPFSLFGVGMNLNGEYLTGSFAAKTKSDEEQLSFLGGKLKKLKLTERYLETFVKEML